MLQMFVGQTLLHLFLDISGSVDKNRTQSKVNEKEIEVLKLQIQELKLKAKNPLAG